MAAYSWFTGLKSDGAYAWQTAGDASSPGPGPAPAPEPGAPAVCWMDAIYPRRAPGEAFTVIVRLADSTGTAIDGESVLLLLSGVTIATPAPVLTDANGVASFTITPMSEGLLSIRAQVGSIVSLPTMIEVTSAEEAIEIAIGQIRANRRAKGKPQVDRPSWQDIGPIAATPRPAPAPSIGSMPQQQTMRPGMAQLGQAIAQLAADQEAKLAAEVQAAQQDLT